jgi:hypothetical protein
MPYTIAFEVLTGRLNSAQKESASGALQMVKDILATGMKVVSITHSSGHVLLIPELERIAGTIDANRT